MDPYQEAAWEDMMAQQDYLNEAYGSSVPDGAVEAYNDECGYLEEAGLPVPSFKDWKAAIETRIAESHKPLPPPAPGSDDDCPF